MTIEVNAAKRGAKNTHTFRISTGMPMALSPQYRTEAVAMSPGYIETPIRRPIGYQDIGSNHSMND